MPLLDDDRIHYFVIVGLILLHVFVWGLMNAGKPDQEGFINAKISPSLRPHVLARRLKAFSVRSYNAFISFVTSINISAVFTKKLNPESPQDPPLPKILELHERNHVFFGANQRIRKHHPSSVFFSIGQVVQHRTLGFRAVVVGWDETAVAPQIWMILHYPKPEKEMRARSQPNYRLLVDTRGGSYEMAPLYVPQDDLERISRAEMKAQLANLDTHESIIRHSIISEYFDFFDGFSYTPRPWLRGIYPKG